MGQQLRQTKRAVRFAEEEDDDSESEAVVPLEYRFRKQLTLPARVLSNKAKEMRAQGKAVLRRVELEVIPEAKVTEQIMGQLPTYETVLLDGSSLFQQRIQRQRR